MTTPNHIAGGIVFTGIFSSFFNVNIFDNPLNIGVLLFGSVLPDIDHTKSIIGKLFYPIAFYISKHYGHRTITHSLVFLLTLSLISLTLERSFLNSFHLSLILFFSVFSHIIFDMMTITGVPLFYPFFKNPCVIPGNINYRIKTGDIKTEGIFLFMFTLASFSMQNLFANGFWNSYEIIFEDIPHIARLYNKNENQININIDYQLYNQKYNDSGLVIFADNKNLFYKNYNNKINHLNIDNQGLNIKHLKSNLTKHKKKVNNLVFNNITIDSLNFLLENHYIYNIEIYSNLDLIIDNKKSKKFKLKNTFDLSASSIDTIQIQNNDLLYQINDIELKIEAEKNKMNDYFTEVNNIKTELNYFTNITNNSNDAYEINTAKEKIIKLKNQLNSKNKPSNHLTILNNNLLKLKNKTIKNNKIQYKISGNCIYN